MAKKTETTKPVTRKEEKFLPGTKSLSLNDLIQIKADVLQMLDALENAMDFNLSTIERIRKRGSGVKRYGFLDKVSDVSSDNMQFAPQMFSDTALKDILRKIEELRNILLAINQFGRTINDLLLIAGDNAYQLALMYYNSVRELARRRVPGAEQTFRILQQFFRHGRRQDEEPTEEEVETDVRALLHGKKDGKIVIEHEKPHLVGGKHVVIDETHKDKRNEELRIEN